MSKLNILRFAALCLTVLCASLPATAQSDEDGLVLIEVGYFCSLQVERTFLAEDTIVGLVQEISILPEFSGRGTTIPVEIGVTFGIKSEGPFEFDEPITIINTHPPMGSDLITRESYTTTFPLGQKMFTGFTFEEAFELVTGEWTFTGYSLNGAVIFTETFNIVPLSDMPANAPSCNISPMTS